VATIGFFDGVHSGHKFLLNELRKIAHNQQLASVVITFEEHPRKTLDKNFKPTYLTTLDEKLTLLETLGIDVCIVMNFSEKLSQLSAREFMKTVLSEKFNVKTLLVGYDHHFGHNKSENFDDYLQFGKNLGIDILLSNQFKTNDLHTVSSSEIRKLLVAGDVAQANKLLSYPYSFRGCVVEGYSVGRKIGFPTANLIPQAEKLLPQAGVYAVRIRYNSILYNGMMNIGSRPTLQNGDNQSIEVHILDFQEDIYKKEIEILFIDRIRNEQKFSSLDKLVERLEEDKTEAKKILEQ
jgi:riboflavin kinase/FMN adenylyltransferase